MSPPAIGRRRSLLSLTRRDAAEVDLICFPGALGGAGTFAEWPRLLPESIQPIAVQLPGRGWRIGEQPLDRIEPIAEQVHAELLEREGRRPVALFGHSMGALIAFVLAQRLRSSTGPAPEALCVAAYPAPHLPWRASLSDELDDARLLAQLRRLEHPQRVSERLHPRVKTRLLASLRADLAACRAYRHEPAAPLDCPIVAFGGRGDVVVSEEELRGWEGHTDASFELRMYQGGHFFVHSEAEAVAAAVRDLLAARGSCP